LNNTCKIITYHYVRPIKDSKYPKIKGLELEGFKRQINYFKKNFKIITQNEIIDHIYENKEIQTNSLLLTFDDGLKDHAQYIFPVLKQQNLTGVFFPPVKPIENKIVLDAHKIHFILETCTNIPNLINEISTFIDKKNDLNIESSKNYYSKLATTDRFDSHDVVFIKKILQRELSRELRNDLTSQLFRKFVSNDEKSFSENLYLSVDEIKEMLENNMEFEMFLSLKEI